MRAGTGISRASVAMLGHREGDGEKLGGVPPHFHRRRSQATRLCSARQAVTSAVLR